MDGAINRFLEHLQADKGFSPNTIVAYRNDLMQLLAFVQTRLGDVPAAALSWSAVDPVVVQEYYATLQGRRYAPTTVARKIASVKSFFHYLLNEKLVTSNPTSGFSSPGIRRALPKTVSAMEVGELLEQSAKRDTPEARRDWAMLTLLYATGMRVTELVKLNIDDIVLDPAHPHVRCLGRSARPRLIPLAPEFVEPLSQYLNNARERIVRRASEQALFVNRRGERLTRQGFWLILKGYVRAANLRKEITPHMLRHTFAAHMLGKGVNLKDLQEFLGHASITTTQVYTQVAAAPEQPEVVIAETAAAPLPGAPILNPAAIGKSAARRAEAATS